MQINDLFPLPLLRLYSYKSSFFRVDLKKKGTFKDSLKFLLFVLFERNIVSTFADFSIVGTSEEEGEFARNDATDKRK